jgi:hypothetical protein
MNGGMSGLLRYWWVLVIGLAVGIGVAIVASYAKDEPYSYSAETRVLVTSAGAPYYRTEVTKTLQRDTSGTQSGTGSQTVQATEPPDLATLIRAANLYPQVVESDLVTRLRDDLYGPMPGVVNAKAIFSFEGANRFEESQIPVVQIVGTAESQNAALVVSDKTTRAFMTYIERQQDQAKIEDAQRVLLQPLTAPHIVAVTGGPVYGIPILLGAAVFLGFCGLALLMDAFARRSRLASEATPAPAPAAAPREEPLTS